MSYRKLLSVMASATLSVLVSSANAQIFDYSKYPDLRGRWNRFIVPGVTGQPSFDQTKSWGFGQEAPLTPEYKAVFEASLADQAKGGSGNYGGAECLPYGMPMMMQGFNPMEFVVTPETTHILINYLDHGRRIFTDGRDWPKEIAPTSEGYSIGKWLDEDGRGRYDVLEVETHGPFKGVRAYDATGLPLHHDNQSVFKERIHLDKGDPNILHDEITVFDHALTRPWTADKRYVRAPGSRPDWPEFYCTESNPWVTVGKEVYFLSADGFLMPGRKDQLPPDLRYFKPPQK